MSNNEFCGLNLIGKVTVVDAAELADKEAVQQNGVAEASFSAVEKRQVHKRRAKKKKEKKSRKADPFDDLKAEEAAIEKIKERFLRPQYNREAARKKIRKRTVKEPTIIVHNDNLANTEIYNTAAYEKSINAVKGLNARYFMKPSILAEVIPMPEICALCQEPAGYESLGFLCGPYYIKISTSKHWPPFLHESLKPRDLSMVYEAGLKFHIRCIATAPYLERVDKFIIGIQEQMPKYWTKTCFMCDCVGATICCSGSCGRTFHFPCAVSSGMLLFAVAFVNVFRLGHYDLNNCMFTCDSCAPGKSDSLK
ncbi:zf-HC5HC2H domain containing protein [Trichuris trichiura]|uniref:Zf-HC5HC2H domain containing protein n=1 Tax=Trichuris trichiura TaxID=36087 RepID=A0A077Z561_TRITR|nr:zf-HC5HC2H domain containing protein [Trichuris trichiura]